MATETIRINTLSIQEKIRGKSKAASLFDAIAYAIESYVGPMNLELLSPRHRPQLTTNDRTDVDARLNGIGTF
ncbi:MAG: hypothetical protein QF878_14010 [SAR202 cluster bacterium]|jgi:hypothetical protein|nr:hypothetical protein [SAR202 cluster bacterium]MDP6714252.1 hypothetical protein [SAR202 cluster bacterium]